MTLKELLPLSAEDWEKISDEELRKVLDPYLSVTRPTKVPAPNTKKKVSAKAPAVNDMLAQLQRLANQAGISKS
jgi:hypothetical protein